MNKRPRRNGGRRTTWSSRWGTIRGAASGRVEGREEEPRRRLSCKFSCRLDRVGVAFWAAVMASARGSTCSVSPSKNLETANYATVRLHNINLTLTTIPEHSTVSAAVSRLQLLPLGLLLTYIVAMPLVAIVTVVQYQPLPESPSPQTSVAQRSL